MYDNEEGGGVQLERSSEMDISQGDSVLTCLLKVARECEEDYSLEIKPGKALVNLGERGDGEEYFLELTCIINCKEEGKKLGAEDVKEIGRYFLDREGKILEDLPGCWKFFVKIRLLDDYVTPDYGENNEGVTYIFRVKELKDSSPPPPTDVQIH